MVTNPEYQGFELKSNFKTIEDTLNAKRVNKESEIDVIESIKEHKYQDIKEEITDINLMSYLINPFL